MRMDKLTYSKFRAETDMMMQFLPEIISTKLSILLRYNII